MHCRYIWDNNLVLDILLDRPADNPSIYELFDFFVSQEIPIGISSSQVHNIKYVFLKERKKILSDHNAVMKEWNAFLRYAEFIKTPSYLDKDDNLLYEEMIFVAVKQPDMPSLTGLLKDVCLNVLAIDISSLKGLRKA